MYKIISLEFIVEFLIELGLGLPLANGEKERIFSRRRGNSGEIATDIDRWGIGGGRSVELSGESVAG